MPTELRIRLGKDIRIFYMKSFNISQLGNLYKGYLIIHRPTAHYKT